MPWSVLCFYSVVALCCEFVAGMLLPPVHWNASNPMFKTSNNDHIVEVNENDIIDFVCPHYRETSKNSEPESSKDGYYIIYRVSKKEYDECSVDLTKKVPRTLPVVNCSDPTRPKRFTMLFDKFPSIPNSPAFKPGGVYYFITTSTGQQDGLSNTYKGACTFRNMKLTIRVCCATTTTSTPKPTPPQTTSLRQGIKSTKSTRRVSATSTTSSTVKTTTPRTTTTTRRQPQQKKTTTVRSKTTYKSKHGNNKNKIDQNETKPKVEGLVNSGRIPQLSSVLLGLLALVSLIHALCRS